MTTTIITYVVALTFSQRVAARAAIIRRELPRLDETFVLQAARLHVEAEDQAPAAAIPGEYIDEQLRAFDALNGY